MSVENNKELVRHYFETIEQEKYDDLKDFCHKDFVFYPQLDKPYPGVEGLIESEKKTLMLSQVSKCQLKQW
ncbi:hypothetical protein NST16_05020 [Bacillus sp. FSL K6-1005]|uniref:hypothetical protein n=1 Tax=Bacillus sp. FSL K6-1005 TaxID=2954676 RepID=UPI0030F5A65C